jgi:hypothetical protein
MHPRALQHRTLPLSQGGLRSCYVCSGSRSHLPDRKGSGTVICTVAPNPTSLQGRAPVHHVSYSSGSCLPIGEGSGASHVLRLWILPPYREGSSATIACPVISCGPWALNIKKNLASMHVQLGLHVPNIRAHVFKVLDRTIMDLQDVWVGSIFNSCKTCEQTATVQHRPC